MHDATPRAPGRFLRRLAASAGAVVAATMLAGAVVVVGPQTPAWAAGSVQVSPTTGLDPGGADIRVRGAGFPEDFGIYVALCVDRGAGANPTPCVGGADMSGGAGASAWISSDPPPYGEGLAQPYGPGGTFDVTLHVVATDPVTGTDCREVSCVIVTKADHTHAADRSQDTRTPVTFAAAAPPATTTAPPPPVTTTAPSTTAPAITTPTTSPTSTTSTPAPTTTSPATTATSTEPIAASTASTAQATTAAMAGASGGTPAWLWVAGAVVLAAAAGILVWWRRQGRTAGASGAEPS